MEITKSTPWSTYATIGIALLFMIRLINIDLPPMDIHYFRQALTLGVARNYLEWDSNFFHPRSLFCDSREGFTVIEFPVYNYLIAGVWKIFGEHYWGFRLLTLIISSLGLWHFFRIGERITSSKSAMAAMMIFGTSIAFIYGRKAMPDVFSLSLVLIGVNVGWSFLEKGKAWRLIIFILLSSLGILSKIPSATALMMLAWPVLFDRNILIKNKLWLCAGGLMVFLAMSSWYFLWIPWAEKQFNQQFYFRISIQTAWEQITNKSWIFTKERFFPIALQSRLAYFFLIAGFVFLAVKRHYGLLVMFVFSTLIFLVFVLQVGEVFSLHEYYIIPFVPVMALITGYGLSEMFKKVSLFLLILFILSAEAIFWKISDLWLTEEDRRLIQVKAIAEQTIPDTSRIMIVSEPVLMPSMMYFSHRKGWQEFDLNRVYDRNLIIGESTVGLEYIMADRRKMPDTIDYPMIYEDNDFRVFRIIGEK